MTPASIAFSNSLREVEESLQQLAKENGRKEDNSKGQNQSAENAIKDALSVNLDTTHASTKVQKALHEFDGKFAFAQA